MRFYLWLDKAAEKFKLNVRKLAHSLCAESISSSSETPQHQLYQHHINYHKKRFSVCTHEARIEINKNNWKRHNSQSLKHFKVCLLCKRTATEGCSYTTIEYVLSSARLDSRHKAHKFARMNQQQTEKVSTGNYCRIKLASMLLHVGYARIECWNQDKRNDSPHGSNVERQTS